MIKIAMIGAGSVVFSKNLTGDILGFPEFRDATISYMDIDPARLEVGASLCRKVAGALNARPRIEATQDLRQALAGADFVINMVQIGGFHSTLIDFEIPRKYGLRFTIADTTGPGGLFRALRTYPMLTDLCRTMQDVCPRAILLNYSNPMSMNMQSIFHAGPVPAVGLCHSVQGTLNQLMGYLGEDPSQVSFVCAGINHMAFYLRLERQGQDLYPRLFEAMNRPEIYATNKVRFELMKRLGHFVTESSEHNAEYSPFFIPHGDRHLSQFGVPLDEYLHRCDASIGQFERICELAKGDKPIEVRRSHEYGSSIVHSVVTGTPRVVYGNLPNQGSISNLPASAVVEGPTLVDRAGLQLTQIGALPPQLVAYMMPHVMQHELFIRAAVEGRRDHVYQACMFDPLTAATLTLDQIVQMCDELIAAHGDQLPRLDARPTLVPASGRQCSKIDAAALKESWESARKQNIRDYIADWHIIGPFAAEPNGRNGLSLATPVERPPSLRAGGSIDLTRGVEINGAHFQWMRATINRRGMVDLGKLLGKIEWAVAYGYAEIESSRAQQTTLRCGSDDGIQIWVNGVMVHRNEIGRCWAVDSDHVPIELKVGRNQILVKVDNYHGGWGFGVAIPQRGD